MPRPSKITVPVAGGDVRILWRDVVNLASVVREQAVQIDALAGRIPSRRRMDVGGGGGSFVIRGEYSPDAIYTLYDVAVISLGLNQGTFVYIGAVPTTGASGSNPTVAPYTGGGYWMQLPGGLLGQWM